MQSLFLLSKSGKPIFVINEDNKLNYVVAYQALNTLFTTPAKTLKMGAITLVYKNMEYADLFVFCDILPLFSQNYINMISNIILSAFSGKFLDVLQQQNNSDLENEFLQYKPLITEVIQLLNKYPYFVMLHHEKLLNKIQMEDLFDKNSVLALIYNEKGIISFFQNSKVKLHNFNENEEVKSLEIQTFYLFALKEAKQMTISSISKNSKFNINIFTYHDNYKLAILSNSTISQSNTNLNLNFQSAIQLKLPQRIQSLSVIKRSQNRGIQIGKVQINQLEAALEAVSEGSSVVIEAQNFCTTAWCYGEYVICIVSKQTELKFGLKMQVEILRAVFEYFAYRTW
ncbi:hypothetical protein SS50377_27583 [Spironucleus salmonicida]|uniref:Uncharacterized protein n=1 Tax=Spironucleus salmonicida TaxID=348837 RepID=V6LPW6_9EUKA|nr:hypothetical protein SS50377_27583 [Spironucleus salmonicida]|eukprot:EST46640.1 Hypothetical protein SS50377_13443 [Spironucleus salmonicida]